MADVNIMEEANKQVAKWQEQRAQNERDYTYTSGKIDGMTEFVKALTEASNAPADDTDGKDTAPSEQSPEPAAASK